MATQEHSACTPVRSQENDSKEVTTPATQLEAAALEAGQHPERSAATAKDLDIGKVSRSSRMHVLLHRFDTTAVPLATVDRWLNAWTDDAPNDAFAEISTYANALTKSEQVESVLQVFLQLIGDAGCTIPDTPDILEEVRSEFHTVAAQLIRVGMLAALEALAPSATAAHSDAAQPGDDEPDADLLQDRRWRLSPDSSPLEARALAEVMHFTRTSDFGGDVVCAHLDGLTSAPKYGELLQRLDKPDIEPGWNAASFASHLFMAGLVAAELEKRDRRTRNQARKGKIRVAEALCLGERACELMGDVAVEAGAR